MQYMHTKTSTDRAVSQSITRVVCHTRRTVPVTFIGLDARFNYVLDFRDGDFLQALRLDSLQRKHRAQ